MAKSHTHVVEYTVADSSRAGLPLAAVVLAVLIGGTLGGGLGFAAHAIFAKPPPVKIEPKIVQQQLTPEELAQLCAPEFKDERQTLIEAQSKVKSLQTDLDARVVELAKYKADAEKTAANREEAVKRWKAKEAEIADLRVKLAEAQGQRDEIMTQLQATIKDLNNEIGARKKAEALADHFKAESTDNLWSAFDANAKVEICDHGSRKRHDKCDDAVEGALTQAMKDRFKVCVDSYQAVPVLKQLDKKGDALPQFAERLPDDNKFTADGWYILFCDPSLPEASMNPAIGDAPVIDVDGTTQTKKPDLPAGDGTTPAAGTSEPGSGGQ